MARHPGTPNGIIEPERSGCADPIVRDAVCNRCGLPFTLPEWDDRHTDPEWTVGGDVHARCCPCWGS